MTGPLLVGAVLAGGGSRRYGRDKASESLAGKSLVTRAAATLASVLQEVVVVSSRALPTCAWSQIPDLRESAGPVADPERFARWQAEQ